MALATVRKSGGVLLEDAQYLAPPSASPAPVEGRTWGERADGTASSTQDTTAWARPRPAVAEATHRPPEFRGDTGRHVLVQDYRLGALGPEWARRTRVAGAVMSADMCGVYIAPGPLMCADR